MRNKSLDQLDACLFGLVMLLILGLMIFLDIETGGRLDRIEKELGLPPMPHPMARQEPRDE